MSRSGNKTPLSQNDYWEVSHAAGRVTSYACSVSAHHIRDGMLRLQFNREVAYYMRGIVRDVAEGRKTSAEGLSAIQKEQKSLISQSRTIALQSLGVVAGGFQIAGGAAMCVGSGGLACTLGVITAAHGANNIYENGRNLVERSSNTQGPLRKAYQNIAGGEARGNLAYGMADIGLSIYGAVRPVLKPDAWRIFKYVKADYQMAIKQSSTRALMIDASAGVATGASMRDDWKKK